MNGRKKLNVLFDARHIRDIYSGLARFTYSVLKAFLDSDEFEKIEVLLDKNHSYDKNPFFISLYEKNYSNVAFTYINAPLFKLYHHVNVSRYVNKSKCDVYFYPHFDLPAFVSKKSFFVIHDLFPLVVENYLQKHKYLKKIYFKRIIARNLFKKNVFPVTVSNSTKNDLERMFKGKIYNKILVEYENYFDNQIIKRNEVQRNNHLKLIKKNYLFYIGDRRPHKNLKQMIDIFEILKLKFNYSGNLVIAGGKKQFDFDLEDYIKEKKFVISLGRVSDEELVSLYKNMDSLFFISTYEGFGLPIVEAAKWDKKIITSNSSSCIEIAPGNALKLDIKLDNNKLASNIYNYLLKDIKIDNKEYLKKFSWKNYLRLFIDN